jgi:hypothetical protein
MEFVCLFCCSFNNVSSFVSLNMPHINFIFKNWRFLQNYVTYDDGGSTEH